jgi:CO/xanthine dehydrogenase Mo-binding subunit
MPQGESPDRIIFSLLDEPVIFARHEFAGAYGQRQFPLSGESFLEAAAALNGSSMRTAAGGLSAAM